MKDKARAHVVITGRVQGVFFRLETQRAAERFGVNGWVRNQRDGSVEAVFEGGREAINALLAWCRKGPPRASVEDVDVQWQDFIGEFSKFRVTH
jgi:acylphosphatase